MLKRIAVLGDVETLKQQLGKKTVPKDLELVELTGRGKAPPATAGVVSDAKHGRAALKIALELAERQEELLHLLAIAVDSREDHLEGSSRRVQEHATRFARALKLDADQQLVLERAALVKDIGKLRVSNEVLLKQSVLTYDEWILLQKHTSLGWGILKASKALKDVAEIVHRHHCCYDGTGYPDGLEGEEIPFLARAMKILDVYCAMTSPRHYRKGHSTHHEALAHLREEQGKHFDPDLIDTFIKSRVGKPWQAG